MSRYLYNCNKCTNKYQGFHNGEYCEWCKPMVDGHKGCYILSGETGKDFVFACDHYTTEDRQVELYPRPLN